MDTAHRVTRQELYELAWTKPMTQLAADFGITGNALAKICDRLLVPHPRRGYWAAADRSRRDPRPPLPPAPPDCEEEILISSRRSTSRREQTRLSLAARREHIAEAAAELVLRDGPNAVNMKAVARAAGVSEALAYRYFPSVVELLAFMARREQALMSEMQQAKMEGLPTYSELAQAATVGFLDYVAKRRGLLQALLSSAELRRTLTSEHRNRMAWAAQASATRMGQENGVPEAIATPGWQILRAAANRAGKLLAGEAIDRETAGRLSSAIMDGARKRLLNLKPDGPVRRLGAAASAEGRPRSSRGPGRVPTPDRAS
ncbi:TetR/AcrR family transcriptional regulator [Phenylobacterium koreense]|uniref:AcrR family transcriptional regulator n=1 Tax=Phenylobacterium koreense TaxID=266125 RepID=A0ABV2ENC8_9CAUL